MMIIVAVGMIIIVAAAVAYRLVGKRLVRSELISALSASLEYNAV